MAERYKTIHTSITIGVQTQNGDESISAQIDGRPEACGGLNKGKTSFRPGDNYWFLVFAPKNAINVTVAFTTVGSASISGTTDFEIPYEDITFDNTDEAKLSKWASSGFDYTDQGSTVGDVTLADDSITLIAKKIGYGGGYASYTTRPYKGSGNIPADYDTSKIPLVPIKLFITAQVPDTEGCGG